MQQTTDEHRAGAPDTPPRRLPLFRAVLLSLIAAPFCCYWAQDQGNDRIFSLMVPPVVLTLVLVALNAPLRRFAPRYALTQADLIVFYGMQSVLCAMASEWVDVTHPFIFTYAAFHDTYAKDHVLPFLSDWLFFTNDQGALHGFTNGGKSAAEFWASLGAWMPKILGWTLIVSLVAGAMLCINAMMEEQWSQREKLSFPLIQLPLAMTEGGGDSPFWRSRLLWGSFGGMFAVDMLNGFHFLYPGLPHLEVRFIGDLSTWMTTSPWNAIGWTPVGIFPFMAAIGVFMPTDVLFSILFFFAFRKAEQIVAASCGYSEGVFGGGGLNPSPPYFTEQSWGAFLGLFVGAGWVARPYLRSLWQAIVQGGAAAADAPSDGTHRLSPRVAFLGLCTCLLALAAIAVYVVGLPPVYVILYTLLFLMFSTAMTRLRAQLGAPTNEMAFMGPNQLFADFHGTVGVSDALVVRTVSTFHFMNRIHRTHPMPTQLEALTMARRSQVSARGMVGCLLLATVVGSVGGHVTRTYLDYRGTPGNTNETTDLIRSALNTPHGPNAPAILALLAGFLMVLALDAIRFQMPGFILHPAGFALSMNFGVDYYWFGLLLALIAKWSAMRYVGLKADRDLRTFALGIILGEFCAEAFWAIFSMLNHDQTTYTISINGKMGWNV